MDEMTKQKKADWQKTEEKADNETKDSAASDQQERKYYYDDAHGYETYQQCADEEGNEQENENK